jgi:hypothetical protein
MYQHVTVIEAMNVDHTYREGDMGRRLEKSSYDNIDRETGGKATIETPNGKRRKKRE